MHGRRVPKSINVSEKADLAELLARVEFDPETNTVKGLDRFQMLLLSDEDGEVLRFLEAAADTSEGKKRGGLVFVLAEHNLRIGSQEKLKALYSDGDAESKESILNGLWGDPSAHPGIGDFVVKLAIESMEHFSPCVRRMACWVIQNQCAWGVDVTGAVVGLTSLLTDEDSKVRHGAAYAAGNLAKKKYDVSTCIQPLRRLLHDEKDWMRNAGAWALKNLAQNKHNIETAVPELTELLRDEGDWSDLRRNAAAALLSYGKSSRMDAAKLKAAVGRAELNRNCNTVKRFLDSLAKLS